MPVREGNKKLPYINNLLTVSVTAAIAAVSVLVHNHGNVSFRSAIIDAVSFGLLTFLIDTAIVYPQIRKQYLNGSLPKDVPESKLLRHTPRQPVLFALLFGLLFIGVTVGFNWLFFRFYELTEMTLGSFLFYRVLYAVFFSAWMTKIIILRYVQPDAFKENVPQHGSETVKAAFPSVSTLKQEFNSARMDFGFNMITGVILGGTRVGMDLGLNANETRWLFIFPATLKGLPKSVFIYSIIIYFMMMVPVIKSIRASHEKGELPTLEKANTFFARLPKNPWLYALVWYPVTLGLAYLFIWCVMTVMHFEVLNFFQYFFIRLACTRLLCKGVVRVSVLRYIQPDTVRR